jgi:hypothetical protein
VSRAMRIRHLKAQSLSSVRLLRETCAHAVHIRPAAQTGWMAPVSRSIGLTTEWVMSEPSGTASPSHRAFAPAASILFGAPGVRRQKILSSRPERPSEFGFSARGSHAQGKRRVWISTVSPPAALTPGADPVLERRSNASEDSFESAVIAYRRAPIIVMALNLDLTSGAHAFDHESCNGYTCCSPRASFRG